MSALTLNPGEAFRTPAANEQPLRQFEVELKAGKYVLERFPAVGVDSLEVAHNFQRLCAPGQYVRVVPLGSA
jgi:hypothetical protein